MISNYIFNYNVEIPLSTVNSHFDVDFIKRYFNDKCPEYIAIHKVANSTKFDKYTKLHLHENFEEINIILGEDLEYLIEIAGESTIVKGNSCICIPQNILHAANAVRGTGYFIAIRINSIDKE